MKLLLAFTIGLYIGAWFGNPPNAEKAYKAGVWTRVHVFRLPPVTQSSVGEGS